MTCVYVCVFPQQWGKCEDKGDNGDEGEYESHVCACFRK